jgi:hypothetical protein
MSTHEKTRDGEDVPRCDQGGWVVGSHHTVRDQAWREGEDIHGCGNLRCGRCGRKVLHYPGLLLRDRPSPHEWRDRFDADGLASMMKPVTGRHPYSTWICGCRAFPCADERDIDTLAIDDDLPWYCAGHGA